MRAIQSTWQTYVKSERAAHLHHQYGVTEVGHFFANDTGNLSRDLRGYGRSIGAPVRRKTFEAPEVGVSTPQNEAVVSSASSVDSFQERQVASQLLAEWHGQVTYIHSDSFTAQLKGRFGEGVKGSEDEAVIPLDDVREEDTELFEVGAFFSLCISYELSSAGSKRRFTEVIFRRMPAFRREELEAATERAKEIVRGLRLE